MLFSLMKTVTAALMPKIISMSQNFENRVKVSTTQFFQVLNKKKKTPREIDLS